MALETEVPAAVMPARDKVYEVVWRFQSFLPLTGFQYYSFVLTLAVAGLPVMSH
jgi:hypothetical protein